MISTPAQLLGHYFARGGGPLAAKSDATSGTFSAGSQLDMPSFQTKEDREMRPAWISTRRPFKSTGPACWPPVAK